MRRPALPGPPPPISILKPLKGHDDGLWDNLLAFCGQEYPVYEPRDPEVQMVTNPVVGVAPGRARFFLTGHICATVAERFSRE